MNTYFNFILRNRFVVILLFVAFVVAGLMVSPFSWKPDFLPDHSVPVDAIPDIGENQQIVFTNWPGRSPQDIEDQVSYPLTAALLGLPKVKTIRSISMFGFSSIYIIFEEDAEFYWARSRIIEKLNSLAAGTLPVDATPTLGPDATGLGQVFWYTLEGRNPEGNATGGWGLDERRSIQDWYVRYALQSAKGVSEVASIGGYVKEYQIDIDPDAMRAYGVHIHEVIDAVRKSNVDVGARTLEFNKVEYVVRGLGFIKSLDDLRNSVIKIHDDVPITLEQIAEIEFGPALRRGVLDKEGVEAVGGSVVARYGENPLEVIENIKGKIEEISKGLPSKTLEDGTVSQLTIIPFYDRSGLIRETIETLETAITQQILITVIVVLLMVWHVRSGFIISTTLPLAVLLAFLFMKGFGVDANIVALSGIAIAIGTLVDMGIVLVENILRKLDLDISGRTRFEIISEACSEVSGAIITAVLTTLVSFMPVFIMTGARGKLFKPLAYTKTFALIGAVVVAMTVLPVLASYLMKKGKGKPKWHLPKLPFINTQVIICITVSLLLAYLLATDWMPLGPDHLFSGFILIIVGFGVLLTAFYWVIQVYPKTLAILLKRKLLFLASCSALVVWGACVWLGVGTVFAWFPGFIKESRLYSKAYHSMPGLGQEFMPTLNEGSFLYMPTTMQHASLGEAMDVLQAQDRAISAIPEVESVVGKIGRVESALDPAPISMIETTVNYVPEYGSGEDGKRIRLWRDHIKNEDDIWDEILNAANIPGTTSAPKLQPIAARIIMLQTGMRAPIGIKIKGPDLESIEVTAIRFEQLLKPVAGVNPATVQADRIVGKPYLEIIIDRDSIARYGINIRTVQDVIEVAVGGKSVTTAIEGRERYPIRLRYLRELRSDMEDLGNILVASPEGIQIPLRQLAKIEYVRGPQMIKSEDTSLISYVIFDKLDGWAEVDVVEHAKLMLQVAEKSGKWVRPKGISFSFTGNYQNQQEAMKRLIVFLPLALLIIFILLYIQFGKTSSALLVFSGITLAWSGGFILIGFYGNPGFMDFSMFGYNLRELFQINTINLSIAVWVGFLALFGIATDNGVIICTYLDQVFKERNPTNVEAIHAATIEAAQRRVRPALMTSATTLLALLPVLMSTGRGSEIMVPMAIPAFGGMALALITIFLVPVLYSLVQETKLTLKTKT